MTAAAKCSTCWALGAMVLACAMPGRVLGAEEDESEAILAIRGGDLFTITDGIIRGGTILIEDGRISRIGTDVEVPEGAEVIDATGKVVMPGLVAAQMSTYAGLVNSSTKQVGDGLDPYSSAVSFALASGITAGFVKVGGPSQSSTGGTNAVIKMTEGDLDGMLIREPVAVNLTYSSSSPRLKAELRESLLRAAEYLREKDRYERDKAAEKKVEEPKEPSGSGTMLKLLRGELPARISASTANDILTALELADDFGIRLILEGVVEGWTVAREIAESDADVVISPRSMRGKNRDISTPSGSSKEQAAILREAGVRFAIVPVSTSFSTSGGFGGDLFTLPLEAAHAVGGGLDEQTALEAITIRPAEMLGVADRIGSLEEGKDADIIVLDAHPLHYSAFVELTLVNGKVLYDKAKSPYFSHIRPSEDDAAPLEGE